MKKSKKNDDDDDTDGDTKTPQQQVAAPPNTDIETVLTPAQPQDATPPVQADTPDEAESIDALPDWAQNVIKELRKENASRRVATKEADQRLGEYLTAIQELVTSVKGSENAPEQASDSKAGERESTPPAANEFLETVKQQLDNLAYENAMLRVVSETDLAREVVESLQGRTYEDLLAQANKIKTYLSPSEQTPESTPAPKNKPPKTPAPADPDTDATKRGRYFGSGVNSSSSVFTKVTGNLLEE